MIQRKTKLAGIIGCPINHSKSPYLHSYWLKKHSINGAYLPLSVSHLHVKKVLKNLSVLGFQGVNVTIPYKETVFDLVDRIDQTARRIGAINTIVIGQDGLLEGKNTDGIGFIDNIKNNVTTWNPKSGPAAIAGAGGAARAIVTALIDIGVPEIRLFNRSFDKSLLLAKNITGPLRVMPWVYRERALDDVTLLVNTTNQGMTGQRPLDLSLSCLPITAVVTDIVYTPLETPLLTEARIRGNQTVDGLGMLLHQAVPGFKAWFGICPEITSHLRRYILDL